MDQSKAMTERPLTPPDPASIGIEVEFVYFKDTGKYYSSHTLELTVPNTNYEAAQIAEEVILDTCPHPGLTNAWEGGPIMISVGGVPRLYLQDYIRGRRVERNRQKKVCNE